MAQAELQRLLSIPPASLDPRYHSNRIAVAHAALEDIRDRGDPHHIFLRSIIEGCADEELFFHCVTGLRQVILWQWNQYSIPFLRTLRDFLMCLGDEFMTVNGEGRTRQLACYTASVSIWKRLWNIEQSGGNQNVSETERSLLQGISSRKPALPNLMSPSDLFQHLRPIMEQHPYDGPSLYLNCLLTEFAAKSAVSYRLPIEFHKEAHRSFEKLALDSCLELAMTKLGRVISDSSQDNVTIATMQLVIDCINWEFGVTAFDMGGLGAIASGRTLVRPPGKWRDYLLVPDFITALFQKHGNTQNIRLKQTLRQLLIAIASLSGPMYRDNNERKDFAARMISGSLHLLKNVPLTPASDESALLDLLQLVSRIITNFRLALLVELAELPPLLEGLTKVGIELLSSLTKECERLEGDVEMMDDREWMEEALALVLECAVVISSDPWLLYSGTKESRKGAQDTMARIFGPLYEAFVRCRAKMAAMEEHHFVRNDEDLDEDKEQILASELEEELTSMSALGRLNLSSAISCLSHYFGDVMPRLQSFWDGAGEVTPDVAALLEEARLLTLYICHLLTDDNEGEAPAIPEPVLASCEERPGLADDISSAVEALLKFSNLQAQKIAANPSNVRLSPLLAKSFLYFLHRWAPAYIYPPDYTGPAASNAIVRKWSTDEAAGGMVNFALSLCLHYQCYWPHEKHVQESSCKLLSALALRKGSVRRIMISLEPFQEIVRFHCTSACLRHSLTRDAFETHVSSILGNQNSHQLEKLWGYHRLAYVDKAAVFTAIIIACSDQDNQTGNVMLNEAFKVLHQSFTSLTDALAANKGLSGDIDAKETACVCIEMFCGVAHTSEMTDQERVAQFITQYLPQLSGLMKFYADDLTVCEALLRFFRDYTEQFISSLDKSQSLALFNASAELLKSYSSHHCHSRVIVARTSAEADAEEEQKYTDISSAIQLLINLGTKDFIDACSTEDGVQSSQVTDVIFFGLQQILPLMTQGLLQYPSLSSQFFELIGFMMDTYPEKVCSLPYDLFDALLQALLFGMSNHDKKVAESSLYGIASIAKEHIQSKALSQHLAQHPEIFYICMKRLLTEVVFLNIVTDRVEAAGMALFPLLAVDVNVFGGLVNELCSQVQDPSHQARLRDACSKLVQPEMIAKTHEGGYEGRMVRNRFKELFGTFVNEVHSFLVLK